MDEEQQRTQQLVREQIAMQMGQLVLANIEANAIIQASREAALKRAREAAEKEAPP